MRFCTSTFSLFERDCVTTSEVRVGVCFACKAHFIFIYQEVFIMFDDIGGKIKKLAVVVTVVGIAVSVILGIVTMKESFFTGLLIACLGGLASWVGSFVLYGFGELIDNTAGIAVTTRKEEENPIQGQPREKEPQPENDYLSKYGKATAKTERRETCPSCFSAVEENESECPRCGQKLH